MNIQNDADLILSQGYRSIVWLIKLCLRCARGCAASAAVSLASTYEESAMCTEQWKTNSLLNGSAGVVAAQSGIAGFACFYVGAAQRDHLYRWGPLWEPCSTCQKHLPAVAAVEKLRLPILSAPALPTSTAPPTPVGSPECTTNRSITLSSVELSQSPATFITVGPRRAADFHRGPSTRATTIFRCNHSTRSRVQNPFLPAHLVSTPACRPTNSAIRLG